MSEITYDIPGIVVSASRDKTIPAFTGGDPDGLTLIISHKRTGEYFVPPVLDGAKWETQRKGAPGKMTFSITRDEIQQIELGDMVDAIWQGKAFFKGYIFEMKRSKDQTWSITAYDQIRYLKNKDTFSYEGKSASQVIKELAEDFELQVGELADTGFVIEKRREQNTTILDMMQNALDITMIHTSKMYVLYDDCGKLMLKDLEQMQTGILVDSETAQDYDYSISIDKNTYNLIKLTVDDRENGPKVYYAPANQQDYANSETRKQWGVLQYFESINPKYQSPQDLANRYLEYYNRPMRTFSIKGCAGDVAVRGGVMLYVDVHLGDPEATEGKLIIAERVSHTFSNRQDVMDLEVRGDKVMT